HQARGHPPGRRQRHARGREPDAQETVGEEGAGARVVRVREGVAGGERGGDAAELVPQEVELLEDAGAVRGEVGQQLEAGFVWGGEVGGVREAEGLGDPGYVRRGGGFGGGGSLRGSSLSVS